MFDKKAYAVKYRKEHREEAKKYAKGYWQRKGRDNHRKYRIRNRERINERSKPINARIRANKKQLVLSHYSKTDFPSCECCGETHMEFLTIDHKYGDGAEHRKQIKVAGGSEFYHWLIKHNLPEGYRVLCFNCNCSLGYFGYCPHGKVKVEKDYKHDDGTLFNSFRADEPLQ